MRHVIPVNDLEPHNDNPRFSEMCDSCRCGAFLDRESGAIIHRAFDGRERLEPAISATDAKSSLNAYSFYVERVYDLHHMERISLSKAREMVRSAFCRVMEAWEKNGWHPVSDNIEKLN